MDLPASIASSLCLKHSTALKLEDHDAAVRRDLKLSSLNRQPVKGSHELKTVVANLTCQLDHVYNQLNPVLGPSGRSFLNQIN